MRDFQSRARAHPCLAVCHGCRYVCEGSGLCALDLAVDGPMSFVAIADELGLTVDEVAVVYANAKIAFAVRWDLSARRNH